MFITKLSIKHSQLHFLIKSNIINEEKNSIKVRILLSSKHTLCVFWIIRPFNTRSAFMFCQGDMRLISKDHSMFHTNQALFYLSADPEPMDMFSLVCFFPHKCS